MNRYQREAEAEIRKANLPRLLSIASTVHAQTSKIDLTRKK